MKIGIITDIHMKAYKDKGSDFKTFLQSLLPKIELLIISGDFASWDYREGEEAFKIIRCHKAPIW